jgi:hypothetical protein
MIISHKHRFVFAEIPHTASHSIAHQLLTHYGGEPIHRHHSNITIFMGNADRETRSYFKFATVRNPLDTAVTDYNKLLGNHKGNFTNERQRKSQGGFVTDAHLEEYRFIQETGADFPAFFKKFRSKLYYNWFLVGRQHYDYVIRFERLQESFSEVLDRLGIEQVEPIGHTNPTRLKKRGYAEFYTPDMYEDVARYYGPFMERWGYEFPPEWGRLEIPQSSRLQFRALDSIASAAAQHLTLDQDHPLLSRVKGSVDRLLMR